MEILVLLAVVTGAVCRETVGVQYEFVEEWKLWKAENERMYHTQQEELERHLVWLSNRKYIEAHNNNFNIFGYTLAMNGFGDMVNNSDANCRITHKLSIFALLPHT